MAEDSWPQPGRNSGQVTILEHESLLGDIVSSGVLSGGLARPAGGALSAVIVPAMTAFLQGVRYLNDSDNIVTIPPNNFPGTTRLDRVVVRLTKGTGVAKLTYLLGTPTQGTPQLPAPANDGTNFDLPVSHHTMVAAQIPTLVGDDRIMVTGSSSSPSNQAPLAPVRVGHLWQQLDTGNRLKWAGTSWIRDDPKESAAVRFGGATGNTSTGAPGYEVFLGLGDQVPADGMVTAPAGITILTAGTYTCSLRCGLTGPGTVLMKVNGGPGFVVRGGAGGGTASIFAERWFGAGDVIAFRLVADPTVQVRGDNFAESGFNIRRVA